VRELEIKVRELQEQLIESGKLETEAAELRCRALEAEKARDDATRGFEALKVKHESVAQTRGEAEACAAVALKELEALRAMLREKEDECERRRLEKDQMALRLCEEKAAMSQEMNKMNDLVEALSERQGGHRELLREATQQDSKHEASGAAAGQVPGEAARSSGGGVYGAIGSSRELHGGGWPGGWQLYEASPPPTRRRHDVKAHHVEINAVAYSGTEPILFTGSSDGTVKVWDMLSSGDTPLRNRATLRDPHGGGTSSACIISVDESQGQRVVAAADRAIKVWDLRTGRLHLTLTGHSNKVQCVRAFSPSSHSSAAQGLGQGRGGRVGSPLLVSGSSDRTVKVWDLRSGREVSSFRASSSCLAVDVSLDGGTLVSGHQDGTVRLWDLASPSAPLHERSAHDGACTSVAFSPVGGMKLLSAGRDNCLRVADARTLDATTTITHSGLRLGCNWSRACFSPDGAYCVAGSTNGSVLVFDIGESGVESGVRAPSVPEASGVGRLGALGSAIGGVVGSTLGRTKIGSSLGNTLGHTLGGTYGSSLAEGASGGGLGGGSGGDARSGTLGRQGLGLGARCAGQLRGHEAAVVSCAWAPGAGGWNQVATVDKAGHLSIWE